MDVITAYLHLPIADPTWIFFVVLCIILFAPMILSKLHIPHLIGMILAGVLVGPFGLNVLERDASFELFGKVGIYFIMFLAGLEMDMQNLKQNRRKGGIFGVITTIIPFAFGFVAAYMLLDYTIEASLLFACILASHTLVSYPLVSKFGVHRDPAVAVSVVATVIALLASLLFLAGLSSVVQADMAVASGETAPEPWMFWAAFAVKFALYLIFIFAVLPHIIRAFFKTIIEPVMQFTFTLAIVFLAAATAEMCGIEGILGAFLSGLVLNRFVPMSSPLMNRLQFVGNALFIPYFLIGVGMLINIAPMFQEGKAVAVVTIMVIAGTVSKYIAASMARQYFGMSPNQQRLMFGLTEAHAAGALAMVMVGTRLEIAPGVPLMSNAVLDGVVMMILISCIISSMVTQQAAKGLKVEMAEAKETTQLRRDGTALDDENILIPVHDINNIDSLMHIAIMMRNRQLKRGLICLNIINDANHTEQTQAISRACLDKAVNIAAAADVPAQPQTRLAVNFVTATIHALKENDASELIIGMHRRRHAKDSYLGQFAQGLIDSMPRQLMIADIKQQANTLRRIAVAVPEKAEFEKGFYRWINRVSRIAEDLGCVCAFHATEATSALIRSYMQNRHPSVRATYEWLTSWAELPSIASTLTADSLLIAVLARRGGISYHRDMANIGQVLPRHFAHCSLLIVYPDMQEETSDSYFNIPTTHTLNLGATNFISSWMQKWVGEI